MCDLWMPLEAAHCPKRSQKHHHWFVNPWVVGRKPTGKVVRPNRGAPLTARICCSLWINTFEGWSSSLPSWLIKSHKITMFCWLASHSWSPKAVVSIKFLCVCCCKSNFGWSYHLLIHTTWYSHGWWLPTPTQMFFAFWIVGFFAPGF